ncbi:P-II family nitrogen regulator [Desulforamulus ferrireducens]|uniref:Transcriptional regulator n=1 Tax=Desulforamulus ferrireducens TaxID=1833852 RepID=A0A1S6J0R3_9FIRM|nr:P-II family nitrogen regulator [Desulforamulus ferrireducens]AQS60609.1 transcriptional regulator [Desulforamulus ferrireducens]
MQKNYDNKELELICMILNFGLASKAIKLAKKNGVLGATVFLGRGTIKNRILEFLEINDSRKEIVLMIAEKATAYKALEALNKDLALHKPNHGIAFTFSVANLWGSKEYQKQDSQVQQDNNKRGGENTMYQAIYTIVDRGNAENVISAANKAGARGGTIINARGSGIHETQTLFAMQIEPEKEMVLIISKNTLTEAIVASIREELSIDEPGKGIIFVLDVNKTYGLY